jgi:hypothetical protein
MIKKFPEGRRQFDQPFILENANELRMLVVLAHPPFVVVVHSSWRTRSKPASQKLRTTRIEES